VSASGEGHGSNGKTASAADRPLILAMPKGRIHEEAVALFAKAGVDLSASLRESRKLVHEVGGIRVLVVKPTDVPTYVEYGAADVGIAGRDTLEEEGRDLYEPLDLGIGACRLAVAEPVARPVDERGQIHIRIATKYPNCTKKWLQGRGLTAEIIKLNGSVELGPLTGLADRIVDLVSSGETLRQNALREVESIMPVTSRLVVNRASLKLRGREIESLVSRLRAAL
jgi:ATP phosphoribosyltransferase